jgi:cytochrome b561
MALKSDDTHYGALARALHWSIAALILGMIATGYIADELPKAAATPIIHLHKATGLLVLGLAVLRLLWWGADARRPGDDQLTWEKWPSRLAKWSLAGLGLALPVSGWLMSSAADKPFSLYGLFEVPLLLGPDKLLAGLFRETHETLATGLILILGAHVAGALRHHFLLRDGVLGRMWGR